MSERLTEAEQEELDRILAGVLLPDFSPREREIARTVMRLMLKRERRAAEQWQPIETAPKDGTVVMLWWPFWCPSRPTLGSFGYRGIQQWVCAEALEGDGDPPTHWRPLPAPPVPASAPPEEE